MSDHCVHSHRTYYLLHLNYRVASRTVTFEMGPSIVKKVTQVHNDQTFFRTVRRLGFIAAAGIATMLFLQKHPRKFSPSENRSVAYIMEAVVCLTYLWDWKYPAIPKWWKWQRSTNNPDYE